MAELLENIILGAGVFGGACLGATIAGAALPYMNAPLAFGLGITGGSITGFIGTGIAISGLESSPPTDYNPDPNPIEYVEESTTRGVRKR